MFTNTKSLIILIIILAVAAGFLVFLNFKGAVPPIAKYIGFQKAQIHDTEPNFEKKLSSEALKRPIQLSKKPVIAPTISKDGRKVLYYTSFDGRVYEVDLDGNNLQQISYNRLNNLLRILWSPNKEEVMGFYNDSGKERKTYFNHTTKQSNDLDSKIYDLAFSPDGKNIAYGLYEQKTEKGGIFISKPDGIIPKEILNTRIKKAEIGWLDNNLIYFYKDSPTEVVDLFILDVNKKQLTTMVETVQNLEVNFAPDKKTLLFSGALLFDKENSLMLKPLNEEIEKLDLNISANDCTWSLDNEIIICSLLDGFWKINTKTKEKTKFFSDLNYSSNKLFLSPLENYLIFINKKDGLLYSLPL